MDIAPTVLHLLGCPVPENMDGRVLSERLVSDWTAQPITPYRDDDWATSARPEGGLSRQEEGELLDRLRNLGYVA